MEHFSNLKAEICRKFSKWYLTLQIIIRYRIQNITIFIMNRALLDKTQIYMECTWNVELRNYLKTIENISHLR